MNMETGCKGWKYIKITGKVVHRGGTFTETERGTMSQASFVEMLAVRDEHGETLTFSKLIFAPDIADQVNAIRVGDKVTLYALRYRNKNVTEPHGVLYAMEDATSKHTSVEAISQLDQINWAGRRRNMMPPIVKFAIMFVMFMTLSTLAHLRMTPDMGVFGNIGISLGIWVLFEAWPRLTAKRSMRINQVKASLVNDGFDIKKASTVVSNNY